MPTIFEARASRFVIALINWYQRHLSPRKGFRCAYGRLHGGDSCSQAIKHRVLDNGVRSLWNDARRQFALCHDAHRTLQLNASQLNAFGQNQADKPFSDDTPFDDAPPGDASAQSRRRPNRSGQNPNRPKGDCQPNCCDTIHCADGCGSLSSCRGASLGAFDCAALDCSALECGVCACPW